MARSIELLIAMVALTVTALTAFTVYRWRKRQHVLLVRAKVEGWLSDRYDGLPKDLSIDCSNNPLWPVLVAFDDPRTGCRHRLQFAYNGQPSAVSPWLIRRAGRRRALTVAGRRPEPGPL